MLEIFKPIDSHDELTEEVEEHGEEAGVRILDSGAMLGDDFSTWDTEFVEIFNAGFMLDKLL